MSKTDKHTKNKTKPKIWVERNFEPMVLRDVVINFLFCFFLGNLYVGETKGSKLPASVVFNTGSRPSCFDSVWMTGSRPRIFQD